MSHALLPKHGISVSSSFVYTLHPSSFILHPLSFILHCVLVLCVFVCLVVGVCVRARARVCVWVCVCVLARVSCVSMCVFASTCKFNPNPMV